MKIADNVFVVTGGGNGIGREVVLALLARGGRVAAVDISTAALDETARLAHAGERLTIHRIDISDRAAVATLPDLVVTAHGRVDGLLNVAGVIQPFVPIADLDVQHIERVMNVNFWGVVHMTQAFLSVLLKRPSAALVNVSSMGAFVAVPGQTAYGASKAAVKLLTEGLYAELRDTRVAVTAVYPGAVETHIAENSGAHITGMDSTDRPPMTSPRDAAAAILTGLEKGSFRVVIGRDARTLDVLSRLTPRRATELIAKKMGALLGK